MNHPEDRYMKRWLGFGAVLAAAAVLLPMDLLAQGPGRAQGGRPQMMGNAALALANADALELDAEQIAALEKVRAAAREATADHRTRMQELRGSGNRDGMMEVMRELRSTLEPFDEQARGVLTQEQQKRLEELRPRRRRRPPGG